MRRAGWIATFAIGATMAAAIGAVAAGVGVTAVPATPAIVPVAAATPSPTQSGVAYPGTQTCLLSTQDGSYTVYVSIRNTADCTQWSQSLAGGGEFWSPLPPGTAAPGPVDQICVLGGAAMMGVTVTEYTAVQEPIGGSVAQGVCTSLEADGWTPQEG